MTEPLAAVSDLEIRLKVEVGSLAGVDLTAAQTALAGATTLVLAAGDASWTSETVPESVKLVVIGCALRTYSNPNGYLSENYGGAYTYTLPETSGYLTEDEVAIVEKAVADENPAGSGFTGSARTSSPYAGTGGAQPVAPWWWY